MERQLAAKRTLLVTGRRIARANDLVPRCLGPEWLEQLEGKPSSPAQACKRRGQAGLQVLPATVNTGQHSCILEGN